MEGEHKVVNLVDEWEVLEEYTGEKLGFYQILNRTEKSKSEYPRANWASKKNTNAPTTKN